MEEGDVGLEARFVKGRGSRESCVQAGRRDEQQRGVCGRVAWQEDRELVAWCFGGSSCWESVVSGRMWLGLSGGEVLHFESARRS